LITLLSAIRRPVLGVLEAETALHAQVAVRDAAIGW